MNNHWDQTSFNAWQDTLSAERKAADQKTLTAVFNKAAKSPTAKAAIEWAQSHGVQFFIDHTCENVAGYYKQGTGAVGIAKFFEEGATGLNENKFIATIAHEIRHAWQDYHGLLQGIEKQDFLTCFMLLSIMEADATAFQNKSEHETFSILMEKVTGTKNADYNQVEHFAGWYASFAPHYGAHLAKQYAREIGIEKAEAPSDSHFEFEPDISPVGDQAAISVQDSLRMIGKDFLGNEWLNAVDLETLSKKIFNPSAAAKFYSDYKKEPDSLVQAICKKQGLSF